MAWIHGVASREEKIFRLRPELILFTVVLSCDFGETLQIFIVKLSVLKIMGIFNTLLAPTNLFYNEKT
jgi:hypothetical protein